MKMSAFFENIKIENFKSLRNVELKDCSRINLFIGKPNVGKSNILEALSLFSVTHNQGVVRYTNTLKWYMRYENEAELFFNGITEDSNFAHIHTNLADCKLTYKNFGDLAIEVSAEGVESVVNITLDEIGLPTIKHSTTYNQSFRKVKKYTFDYNATNSKKKTRLRLPFLEPPFGSNLMKTIEQNGTLSEECIEFFKRYDLDLVFDRASNNLKVMKTLKNGKEGIPRIFLLPYSSVADTLQRIIFYKTAIASNKNSILLFEEPEAHSFPPYIVHITQEMIWSKENQFFLTTHSPFVLNDFLENAREDLAVYLVDWVDGESTVKRLSDEELHKIYQYGVDLFTNLETFI
jgi:AAA15 family ATPase/GTPase